MIFNFKKTTVAYLCSFPFFLASYQTVLAKKAKEYEDAQIGIKNLNEKSKARFEKPFNCFENGYVKLFKPGNKRDEAQFVESFKLAFKNKPETEKYLRKKLESGGVYAYYLKETEKSRIQEIKKCPPGKAEEDVPVSFAIIEKPRYKSYQIDHINQRFWYVCWFWTDPLVQRQGCGEKLLDYLVEESFSEGFTLRLSPTTTGENLYKKILLKNSLGQRISIANEGLQKNIRECGKLKRSKSYGLMKTVDKGKWHQKKMVWDE